MLQQVFTIAPVVHRAFETIATQTGAEKKLLTDIGTDNEAFRFDRATEGMLAFDVCFMRDLRLTIFRDSEE